MPVLIGGKLEELKGVKTVCWSGRKDLWLSQGDRRRRTSRWVRILCFHTTIGDSPHLVQGSGPVGLAERTARGWLADPEHAGSHLLLDGDGTVYQTADLESDASYHATSINDVSIGVEVCQRHADEAIFQTQMDAAGALADALAERFGIARQLHEPFRKYRPVLRLKLGGRDYVGACGHRDQTDDRGSGDPGDDVVLALRRRGWKAFDFSKDEDKAFWKPIQEGLKKYDPSLVADGVPGPATVRAVKASGHPSGLLW